MSLNDADIATITGTLLALGFFFYRLHKAESRANSLHQELVEINKRADEDRKHFDTALRGAKEYYDGHIDRHEKHIDTLKKVVHLHKSFIDMDTKFIDMLSSKLERYEKENEG